MRLRLALTPVVSPLLLAFTVWTQTGISQVYTFRAVLAAAVIYLLVRWGQARAGKGLDSFAGGSRLLWDAFTCGHSMAHHRTMIMLLPGISVCVAMVGYRVYADRRLLAHLVAVAPRAGLYDRATTPRLPAAGRGTGAGDCVTIPLQVSS